MSIKVYIKKITSFAMFGANKFSFDILKHKHHIFVCHNIFSIHFVIFIVTVCKCHSPSVGVVKKLAISLT